MCEPFHSINQMPEDNDKPGLMERLGSWAKKIGGYFHFSKFGKGHSESIDHYHPSGIVDPTRFETFWWSRQVKLDGSLRTLERYGSPAYEFEKIDRLDSAKIYAEQTVIGNLHLLRNFLETSIRLSEYPDLYMDCFITHFLNNAGREYFYEKLQKHLPNVGFVRFRESAKQSWVNALMGLTRKRKLIVPEWADDNKLWLPKGDLIMPSG